MGHLICCGRRRNTNAPSASSDANEDGVERFRRFWDDKLKEVADLLSLGRSSETEASRNPFHVTLQLYAHKDVVDQLFVCYDEHPDEVEFYIPQLCTFLLHGQYDKNPALEFFLLSQCRRSLQFAHRLHWFLDSFCTRGTTYQSEGLSATVNTPSAEDGHLLHEIARQGGVPAKLFSMGLTEAECAVSKELMATRLMALQVAETSMDSPDHLALFQATPRFLRSLTDLADRLIPLPIADRKLHLRHGLAEIEATFFPTASTIYLPIGDTMHRVKRVVIDECFPFSTKERVPYLVCVEVVDFAVPGRARRGSSLGPAKSYTMKLPFNHRVTVAMSSSDDLAFPVAEPASNDGAASAAQPATSTAADATRPAMVDVQPRPRQLDNDGSTKTFVVESFNKSFTLSFRHGEEDDGEDEAGTGPDERDDDKVQVMGQWAKRPHRKNKQDGQTRMVELKHQVRSMDDDVPLRHGMDGDNLSSASGSPSVWSDADDGAAGGLPSTRIFHTAVEPDKSPTNSAPAKPVIAFRERWSDKERRLRQTSPFGMQPGWRLVPIIVKSHDDLRQEQFAAQIIAQCHRIFVDAALPLALRPYAVLATTGTCGLIEAVPDTVSLDSLKKNDPDYKSLLDFYERYFGSRSGSRFKRARVHFVQSLAAYSILCFVFQIKDRHNGNILVDADGYIIHIDFGFLFTNSPGGNIGFESAPFKLTDEFVELLQTLSRIPVAVRESVLGAPSKHGQAAPPRRNDARK
ncbi:hypothetical protein, variant [Aphanomyces invadans]|uniref:PI3K/PI4K catalytic domain-containing protein n=1 Tax=Aphanomyces invadans TaxID=157072 RepID=A0A024UL00_9STRA|nr:hypothetical protein, variant [Aphanomyces invadans]ETW06527.1 hypothetical protein, variant [Aphanomyces invadans]|eukprot:XP_008864602.1 hypothetical protein, variant [Aphanomyces invadans]